MSPFPSLSNTGGVAEWSVEIIERVPHDPTAFTQGLEIEDGVAYESTGLWGESSVATLDPQSWELRDRVSIDDDFFGEGVTVVDDRLIQLTWLSEIALVYDRHTLEQVDEFRYDGEGWGLCHMESGPLYSSRHLDGDLWMSDGSNHLTRRDPNTFEVLEVLSVGDWENLNELECIDGMVVANIWQTDSLIVIDVTQPGDATVVATIDAAAVVVDAQASAADMGIDIDVLNGVADPQDDSGTLWMTGKLWPYLYRVRLTPA